MQFGDFTLQPMQEEPRGGAPIWRLSTRNARAVGQMRGRPLLWKDAVGAFRHVLEERHHAVTVRGRRTWEIAAACGQRRGGERQEPRGAVE